VAKERAATEGGSLHYMNTCDWAYAMAFRSSADEIERLRAALELIAPRQTAEGLIARAALAGSPDEPGDRNG
jgi:hypothetical protein